jgi:hypothetical protein
MLVSMRGNKRSVMVQNISMHDTVLAYVNSSELCARSNRSRLDSRRKCSIECIPMDDRLPLSKYTVADALLEDDIFYRNDIKVTAEENDSSSPTSTPFFLDPSPLGEGNNLLEPLAEEDDLFEFVRKHWIGRVCLPSFCAVRLCE